MPKVLIVDDEPQVRNTLKWAVSKAGYQVETAADQAEAFDKFIRQSFDFALIDVRLFGGGEDDNSGIALAIALQKFQPATGIILLTKYVRTRQIVRAVRYYGILDFVEKTPDIDTQVITVLKEAEAELSKLNAKRKLSPAYESTLSITICECSPILVQSKGSYVFSDFGINNFNLNHTLYSREAHPEILTNRNWKKRVDPIGESLWSEIFEKQAQVAKALSAAREKSQRVSLVFETSRENLGLPFEFIRSKDPNDYIVLQYPLSRFVSGISPRRSVISPEWMALQSELRILIIASNTRPFIDGVEREVQEIYNYLSTQDQIPVKVTLLSTNDASYDVVKNELASKKYDVVHYAGHGYYDANLTDNSSLVFWSQTNKQGEQKWLRATELVRLLRESEARLFYLSCCLGSTSGDASDLLNNDFLGIADAVIQAGIPSALGYRSPVSDSSAIAFAKAFYESLLSRGRLDVALWEARCNLADNRSDSTWLSPILISQQ
jgi:ActR/RegA family two-component response regulator